MNKKVKRTISLIFAAIMLLSTMSVLAFAAYPTAKEIGPHDCVAGPEKEDVAAYAQPTCTKAGSRDWVKVCTICGKELSRVREYLPALDSHVPADTKTIEKVVEPTCADEGSYYEVTRCKFCNKVLEKELKIVNKTTAHVADLPVKEKIVDATCAKVGSYDSVIYCKVCGKELQRTFKEVPKLTYHVSSLPSSWIKNTGYTRTCKDGEDRCVICGELLQPAVPHVWSKPGYKTDADRPTLTKGGKYTYTCVICGATKTEATPRLSAKRGDVNADGVVNTADARLVLRYAVGLGNFDKVISSCCNDDSFKAADFDKNTKIEAADARLILRVSVGLPV